MSLEIFLKLTIFLCVLFIVCLRIQVNKENKEFKVFISEQNLDDNFIYIYDNPNSNIYS